MGRPPIGKQAMTDAERHRRYMARLRQRAATPPPRKSARFPKIKPKPVLDANIDLIRPMIDFRMALEHNAEVLLDSGSIDNDAEALEEVWFRINATSNDFTLLGQRFFDKLMALRNKK